MTMIALPAHYDGTRICLDEEYPLELNTKLIVTILPQKESDHERKSWLQASAHSLERAYGEAEPDYSVRLIKEVNPSYEAW